MDIQQSIKNRKSVRAFLDKPLPRKNIEQILNIARWAPSGVNTQPWQVIVLESKALRKKLGEAIIQARENGQPENPDYDYYPHEWCDPYKTRRKACGAALYSALHIAWEDKAKRKQQWYKNYTFFGAPVGLLFFLDKHLAQGAWVDMGMFIQNVMLAAQAQGLATCPQASMAEYPDIVREHLQIPPTQALVCGMALGFEDTSHPVNQYRTPREPIEVFTHFV